MRLNYLDIPFELNLTEQPDLPMLELITTRFHELKIPFTNPKNVDGDKVIGNGALKIWNQYRDKVLENNSISYQSSIKNKPNRMYAKGSSCQGLPSIIRNSLYRHHATDTDIKICHPTIARSIAKHFELPYFMFNDLIENREEILSKFVERLGWSRTQAKRETNRLLMGGGIPIEVKKDVELWDWMDKYKAECKGLASYICTTYPSLFKDSQKREKDNPNYSTLSIFICNIENQIVLKAMEYLAQQGVKIYVYTFDGFLHSKWTGHYLELNEFILRETGIPIEFVSKEMDKFIEFDNVLELKEIIPSPHDSESPILIAGNTFDFKQIEAFCSFYKNSFIDVATRNEMLSIIRKYCDGFFTTIECEDSHLIAQDFFHTVNNVRRRKYYQLNKYTTFRSNFSADKITIAGNVVGILFKPCFTLWNDYFLWECRNKKNKIDFYPSMEPQPFYNVFSGFHIQPSGRRITEDTIQPFIDHIRIIWCKGNEEYFKFVISWMAKAIQIPWIKTKCAIVLKGAEGCGKGIILSHFLGGIMGQIDDDTCKYGAFRQVVKEDSVFGRFNDVLEGCCGLFLDELVWGGDKKASGKLKGFITEDFVQIEHKGIGIYPVHSYLNLVIASNEEWVIPASDNTRRFFVLECDNKYAGVQTHESKEYFDTLLQVPIQDVADYLYQYDISGFNSVNIPLTEALDEQKEIGMSSSYLWMKEQLSLDNLTSGKKDEIYHQYTDWCKETHQYKTLSNISFWKNIQPFISKQVKKRHQDTRWFEMIFKDSIDCIKVFKDQFKMDIHVLEESD